MLLESIARAHLRAASLRVQAAAPRADQPAYAKQLYLPACRACGWSGTLPLTCLAAETSTGQGGARRTQAPERPPPRRLIGETTPGSLGARRMITIPVRRSSTRVVEHVGERLSAQHALAPPLQVG
jgi:hypothetical protein